MKPKPRPSAAQPPVLAHKIVSFVGNKHHGWSLCVKDYDAIIEAFLQGWGNEGHRLGEILTVAEARRCARAGFASIGIAAPQSAKGKKNK